MIKTKKEDTILKKMTLRAARINAGFSQKEASNLLLISNKTLSSWEKGDSFPSAKKIECLCKLYDISYDDINFLPNNSLKAKKVTFSEK